MLKLKLCCHSGLHCLSETRTRFLALSHLLLFLPVSKGKDESPVFTFATGNRLIAYYAAHTYRAVIILISQADERHSGSNSLIISALS